MLRTAGRKNLAALSHRRDFAFSSPFLPTSARSIGSRAKPFRLFSSSDSHDNDEDGHNSNNNNNNNNNDSTSGKNGITIVMPSKIGYGDEAPRTPHVLALPVVHRPLFPGVVTSVTLTEPATIDALDELQKKNQNAYISVFLRKTHTKGTTESGLVLPTPEVITDISDLHSVGTFAQIHRLQRGVGSSNRGVPNLSRFTESSNSSAEEEHSEGPAASVLLLAHRRVDLLSIDDIGPPVGATVGHWPRLDYTGSDDTIRALSNEILNSIREVAQINPLFRENVQFFSMRLDANDPYRLADFAASVCSSGKPEDLQALLEEKDPEVRLHKALVLLSREREVSKLQQEISSKVEEKMSEAQRRYFLMEQLKSIKKELGMERDDKDAVIEKFRKQLAEYPHVPEDVMTTIEAELEKLSTLEMNSSEYNVTRNYLEWLCGVPWGVMSKENFDIRQARKVLDRDHYGLDDVKDTILEFIAVGKLKGSVQGKIVCLAGPPGTGKTSIAKSVAGALGREFYRFSVGGLSQVSEIKGHRRTYVGAMPGKIIQCLKTTGTTNPVILIDEIDKLGHGYQGDPSSALLEVLDPNQNSSFHDHYLDIPVDISNVLFMCTANDLDRIPGPLLDRMEVIQLSGYDFPEKIAIAEQYLLPKSMKDSGLMVEKSQPKEEESPETTAAAATTTTTTTTTSTSTSTVGGTPETTPEAILEATPEATPAVDLDEKPITPLEQYVHADNIPETVGVSRGAIEHLVRWYAREAGVRHLSKLIDKITRKLALQVVAEEEGAELTKKSKRKSDTWQVTEDNLVEYVGKQIFLTDRMYDKDPLPNGIVMGLAYTSMGGSALYIETQGIKRGLDKEGKPRGGGTLKATGKLGDVMVESTQIAYTVARAWLSDVDSTNQFFDNNDIHMHVPEGATPKDGPSAGIAMVTSMLSLALEKPIRNDLAMTGEVSLTGKVLPVGGIKEKIMGGRRAGVTTIILPGANERDYVEIPDYLKDGLDVRFANDYEDVFKIVFGDK